MVAVAADDPEAMPLPCMMGRLPAIRNHRSISDLDDQVAHSKTGFIGHAHEIAMGPPGPMVIDHVGNLRQQQAFRLEDAPGFLQERWV